MLKYTGIILICTAIFIISRTSMLKNKAMKILNLKLIFSKN
jgi:hypothetical protein